MVSEILVGCWDVEFYGFQKYKSWQNIKIRGRGGTNPRKALEETIKIKKPTDIVIILTDGEWFEYPLNLLKQVKPIIVTTHKEVYPELFKNIKIEPKPKYPY